jgi:3-deoxy-7-phosphoheptulonate synthase/chorismate mutase
MATDPASDPLIARLREQITKTDLRILKAVNRRLELVRRLKEHKDAEGYEFVDKGREEALLAELERQNAGPLSTDGLRKLHAEILDLTKRELG